MSHSVPATPNPFIFSPYSDHGIFLDMSRLPPLKIKSYKKGEKPAIPPLASTRRLDPIGRPYFRQPNPNPAPTPKTIEEERAIDYPKYQELHEAHALAQEDSFFGAWSALMSHLPFSYISQEDPEDVKQARQANRDRARYLLFVLPACLHAEPWEEVVLPDSEIGVIEAFSF